MTALWSARSMFLMFAGCTWVTDADLAKRKAVVDDDGDGVSRATDCNDGDATISPAVEETWYDGIDQDCAGGDDYDQDGDGYVSDEHQGLPTEGVEGSGTLEPNDCDDTDARVSPKQPDEPYDGVDRDCGGEDDYDVDTDGFVANEYAGLATSYVDGSGALPGGDCDDEAHNVNPAAVDEFYDGTDLNCDGRDDYDQDGDGFVEAKYYGLPTKYVSGSGTLPTGDCDDLEPSENPGEQEIWYDGIDGDCAGGDDYDQDQDEYVRTEHVGLPTEDLEGTGTFPGGDCDDGAGGALIHPRATEKFGDGIDQDCDGVQDGIAADDLIDWTWTAPASLVFGEGNGTVYLSVAATGIVTPRGDLFYDSALALKWVPSALGHSAGLSELPWYVSSVDPGNDVTGPHDVTITDNFLYGVVALTSDSGQPFLAVTAYPVGAGVRGSASPQDEDVTLPFEDVAIDVDAAGNTFVVGCSSGSDGLFSYLRIDEGTIGYDVLELSAPGGAATGSTCAIDGDAGIVYSNHDGGYYAFAFDPAEKNPTFSGSPVSPSYTGGAAPDSIDTFKGDGTGLVVADAAYQRVVVDTGDGSPDLIGEVGDTPVTASAWIDEDARWIVGWVNADGTARLAFGSPAAGWDYVTVSAEFAVEDVAVYAAEGTIAYAAVGGDELGIGFLDID